MPLLPTSGTSGAAKLVELTHRNLVGSAERLARNGGYLPTDRHYLCSPFFHVNGQAYICAPAFVTGGSIALVPRFSLGYLRVDPDRGCPHRDELGARDAQIVAGNPLNLLRTDRLHDGRVARQPDRSPRFDALTCLVAPAAIWSPFHHGWLMGVAPELATGEPGSVSLPSGPISTARPRGVPGCRPSDSCGRPSGCALIKRHSAPPRPGYATEQPEHGKIAALSEPTIAGRCADLLDHLADYCDRIDEVTREQVVRVARELVGNRMDRPSVRRTRRRR